MPEPSAVRSAALEGAKNFVLLVREGAVTIAILGLVGLLLFSPATLRATLEQAGIQSVKLPLVEIETSLKQTQEQLASARQEVDAARAAASQAQTQLTDSKVQLEQVLRSASLAPVPKSQLQALSGRLATSKDQVAASTARLSRVAGTLEQSVRDQRVLIQRVQAVRK